MGEEIDAILDGDFTVAVAQVTPLRGVVLAPVNSFGWDAGNRTFRFTSDLAAYKKLRRMERNPKVAIVFHTRDHGVAYGEGYIVVQGDASFSWHPDHDELADFYQRPGTALGPDDLGGPVWDRWLAPFWWDRVVVRVRAHRIIAFADRSCSRRTSVLGAVEPLGRPAPQAPPRKGAGPRVDVDRVVRELDSLPPRLLGWVGADGYPMVTPVQAVKSAADGLTLTTPAGLVPSGGRRAGLTGHAFTAGTLGQRQVTLTGWLESDGASVHYAPHTRLSYTVPASRLVWRTVVGTVTRVGLERARHEGVPSLPPRRIHHMRIPFVGTRSARCAPTSGNT
ncbi:hypothetical protein [Nocardia mexicana]|uniref:hypothetical protein n=1 Tax=Nocardia mexicana TaxID=279262 RepID=UPI00083436EF|nr:hypothetical protein [Nocardia mexicana]